MMLNPYNLPKPFWALAPMAGITTYPFARQAKKYGADLLWTPMVHTDTILNNWPEAKKILDFKEIRPYLVQILGNNPQKIEKSIKLIEKNLKPTGIDLNFACPDKNVLKSGCGGALLKKQELMIEIAKAAINSTRLPISIKTRLGWDKAEIMDLAKKLEKIGVSLLAIHGRTVLQGFKGEAEWGTICQIKKNTSKMLIAGSGDIKTYTDAIALKDKVLDGYLVGRASLGRPWIFQEVKEKKTINFGIKQKKELILEIAKLSEEIWGKKGIIEARKHFAWYAKGFLGASELRKKLMLTQNSGEVIDVLRQVKT